MYRLIQVYYPTGQSFLFFMSCGLYVACYAHDGDWILVHDVTKTKSLQQHEFVVRLSCPFVSNGPQVFFCRELY